MSKKCKNGKKHKLMIKEMEPLSNDELIVIHTETYYKALKRVKEDDIKELNEKEQRQYKPIQKLLLMLNVIFWPWRLSKKFTLNGQIYDGFLVIAVSGIMELIGTIVWGSGIWIFCKTLFGNGFNIGDKLIQNVMAILIAILLLMIGSLLYISGKSFENEKNSNKIYAYSASIFALISCVIGVLSIVK